ncbi:MAG: TonB family protein [Aquificae bacterium]|nr:TonB family protein [Aquificota bacterium]
MLRYLLVSFVFNLFLFLLYSYWMARVLGGAFAPSVKPAAVEPLFLTVEEVRVKFEELTRKGGLSVSGPAAERPAEKPSEGPSLLAALEEEVKKEFQPLLRKVSKRASVEVGRGGKVELGFDRKLVFVPDFGPVVVETPPAPAVVKVVVLPDGRVVEAVLVKKSGNARLDEAVLNFSRRLRFEPIGAPVVQEIFVEYEFTF